MLCAYYVSEYGVVEPDLRQYLRGRLPHYMVPSLFFNIDKIPLTPNGKIDKNLLPGIDKLRETKEIKIAERRKKEYFSKRR